MENRKHETGQSKDGTRTPAFAGFAFLISGFLFSILFRVTVGL
jgi:hypothetical protein